MNENKIEFIKLKILDKNYCEDIIYFLRRSHSHRVFKQTKHKIVYSVRIESKNMIVVTKQWFERGLFRHFKNYIKGGSRAVREARNILLLQNYIIGVPPLIAYGNYRSVNANDYISFIITKFIDDAIPYSSIVESYYRADIKEDLFFSVTKSVIKEISKMHLNGITHNDMHPYNILVELTKNSVYFIDTLAVKKRYCKIIFALLDIAKLYYWITNKTSGTAMLRAEREYLIHTYFQMSKALYPFKYSIFQLLIKISAFIIRITYKLNRTIRNIQ